MMLRGAAAALMLFTSYLLLLVAAATRGRRPSPRAVPESALPRFLILVPAHDEALVIDGTLAALNCLDYPPGRRELVVIADNCTDGTAELARRAGATVLERNEPEPRGKGAAIAWALERLLPSRADADAVVLVDADCTVSANLLQAVAARFEGGAAAVQVAYEVANPTQSVESALRFAGFGLVNVVRPRGKAALGLSCGLFGTGMAFRCDLIRRVPWLAGSLAEDAEQHLVLVDAGEVVHFSSEASVTSPMPTRATESHSQQMRWEAGRLDIVRRWVPRLLASGLRERDPQRLHAAFEQLVPPQSITLFGHLTVGCFAAARRDRSAVKLTLASAVGQIVYVFAGLALIRAPRAVYVALLAAPGLVVRKLRLYGSVLTGRGPRTWRRTTREAPEAEPAATPA